MCAGYHGSKQMMTIASLSSTGPFPASHAINGFLCHAGAGLAELGQVNEAFKPFAHTLFSQDRVGVDLSQETKATNETIRHSIESLLTLLSPHFMRDAATRILEFLIRQYRQASVCCSLCISDTRGWRLNCYVWGWQ